MTVLCPLSTQPVLKSGNMIVGAQIRTYDAQTLNPRIAYSDGDALTPLSNPFFSDGDGCIPPFFMKGGAYRVRILTPDGVTIRDIDNIAADTDSGSTPDPVTTGLTLQTGDVFSSFISGLREGCVRANGGTIGNSLSGASERADDDTQALFTYLWNGQPFLVVSGGRGLTAAADFTAGKRLTLPDARGRALFGYDDMGAVSAGRLANGLFDGNGTGVGIGSTGGEATHTAVFNELPYHTHNATLKDAGSHNHTGATGASGGHTHNIFDPGHNHSISFVSLYSPGTTAGAINGGGAGSTTANAQSNVSLYGVDDHKHTITADGSHTHEVTVEPIGPNKPANNMPPFILATWYIVL